MGLGSRSDRGTRPSGEHPAFKAQVQFGLEMPRTIAERKKKGKNWNIISEKVWNSTSTLKIPLSYSPASFTWAGSVPRGGAVCDVLSRHTFLGTIWCRFKARLDESCSNFHHNPTMPHSKADAGLSRWHQTAAPRGIFRVEKWILGKVILMAWFPRKVVIVFVWKIENQQAKEEERLFMTTFITVDCGVKNVFVQQCNLLLVTEEKGETIDLSLFYICFLLFTFISSQGFFYLWAVSDSIQYIQHFYKYVNIRSVCVNTHA